MYIKKNYNLFKTTQKNLIQKKKLDMTLLVGQRLQDVHLIKENKFNYYRGKVCIENFCKKLKESAMEIINHKKKEMIPLLIQEENNFYNEQEVCYICKKKKFCMDKNDKNYINKKKVKDHCHYTGKFREAAHSK